SPDPFVPSQPNARSFSSLLGTPPPSFPGPAPSKLYEKERPTRKPHNLDFPPRLHEPLLQKLHLRRLPAAVQPLQHDERLAHVFALRGGGYRRGGEVVYRGHGVQLTPESICLR